MQKTNFKCKKPPVAALIQHAKAVSRRILAKGNSMKQQELHNYYGRHFSLSLSEQQQTERALSVSIKSIEDEVLKSVQGLNIFV